jgi:carbamoyl-phosphate synthase large subunit
MNRGVKIIGSNTKYLSSGNHLCDRVRLTPFATDSDYIQTVRKICEDESINLIIPSTDYECYCLSIEKNRELLPTVATSPEKTNEVFLDKYRTSRLFDEYDIPFAKSVLPSGYGGEFEEVVVKPREGRGSRDVYFDPENIDGFNDGYVVQKRYIGEEVTTAFYVTKGNELHGFVTFLRELESGATHLCEVTHAYDDQILEIIRGMMSRLEIRGSCNIQSIVTSAGRVVPFEVNGRISGTNSIRSQFGFKDVQYTAEEYLFNQEPEAVYLKNGSAVRVLMDVIYPDIGMEFIHNNENVHYLF